MNGADTVVFYPVVKAKRFASLETLIEQQDKYLTKSDMPEKERDKEFDYVEDFEYYAMLTGAFKRDL